ncbi:SIR2 family protein [Polaromonas sp. YR568]|uniref:SIR2 family protein n=1 Tax=Polaromonas sp. YR568 TaxID=1855301 RepID=UPI00398BCE8E
MLNIDQLSAVKSTLFSGQYNLLLGSGVSLDSTDRYGKPLLSARKLTEFLCELKGVNTNTPLSRISLLLDAKERDKYLTQPYCGCRAGETAKRLTSFVWRNAFTFNIDDVLESAYESVARPKQKVESLNYGTTYKTAENKSKLQIVHLHGYTREPEHGYVFSTSEYGRATRGMNPWMHVLAELIASEPFIISGTSLNEPDLEYYLKDRTEKSARSNRGPSLFIEPYPDKITESLCERHGLILVRQKLGDFLAWLTAELGGAPTVAQLTVPTLSGLFSKPIPPSDQVDFFSSFEVVRPAAQNAEGEVPPFYFGRPARWSDLESGLDVPTDDERDFTARARNFLDSDVTSAKVMCLIGDAGSGKTTNLRRVAYDLSKGGYFVLNLPEKTAIDTKIAVTVLESVNRPVAILIDGLAEQARAVRNILLTIKPSRPIVFMSADRKYREDHVDRVLGDLDLEFYDLSPWSVEDYEQLIERLRKVGLAGTRNAIYFPQKLAEDLLGEVVAIGTCRALNDFKPLESIVKSVWHDATKDSRRSYAIAALAEHCYPGGISYAVLQAAQPNSELKEQLTLDCPLPLDFTDDGDYVIPLHPVIADRLLKMLSREKSDILLQLFCSVANSLSPYVNRSTTIARTPEARLAARLFSSEKVVRPLLGHHAAEFYTKTKDAWQWNPRYWEQRAILTQGENIDVAIQYARHAVAIDPHPFPWTTLASLLTKKLEALPAGVSLVFEEIYDFLFQVFRYEANSRGWRPTPHPYATLFHASIVFLDKGGVLPPKKLEWILQRIDQAEQLFKRENNLIAMGKSIRDKSSIRAKNHN